MQPPPRKRSWRLTDSRGTVIRINLYLGLSGRRWKPWAVARSASQLPIGGPETGRMTEVRFWRFKNAWLHYEGESRIQWMLNASIDPSYGPIKVGP
jgi:hypothetical protein